VYLLQLLLPLYDNAGGSELLLSVQSYRDLKVWQIAVELALESYRRTSRFPADERYGLASQIRRAATAVAANIAEGHGRAYRREYAYHLSVARGSVMEVEVHFLIAERLNYVASAELELLREYCDAASRMLTNLQRSLKRGT